MAIENEIVRFIAEMELDPQDQAKFVEGLRKAEDQCESLRKAISDTGNEMAKMKAEGKDNTAEYERLSKQLKNYNSALKATTKETDSYTAALSTNQILFSVCQSYKVGIIRDSVGISFIQFPEISGFKYSLHYNRITEIHIVIRVDIRFLDPLLMNDSWISLINIFQSISPHYHFPDFGIASLRIPDYMIFLLRDIFPDMFLEIVVISVREYDGRKNNPYKSHMIIFFQMPSNGSGSSMGVYVSIAYNHQFLKIRKKHEISHIFQDGWIFLLKVSLDLR